ncbi:MAG: radical SAM protein, partial [Rhodospirillales bacterium]|nr:radical SAM protein [Rhodospirillales bacterium]
CADELAALNRRHGEHLTLRVSLDHYSAARHEELRGARSWQPTLDGISWLCDNGFRVHIAGRTCWDQNEAELRTGYGELFTRAGLAIDPHDPESLILFPEMDMEKDVPEITEQCWDILGVAPDAMMCATSRMVVKRKGAARPAVLACTLLAYDPRFELGETLAEASDAVSLNHPHCATFCVLGGGSCSVA